MAKRITALDAERADNRQALDSAVNDIAPELCELPGVGAVVAGCVLMTWSHPDGFDLKPRSPPWREHAQSRHRQETRCGTDSIGALIDGSTER